MKVNEIFQSIEGEGKRAGLPCIFIRLFGCNLNCSYCDTRYSCEGNDYTVMSIGQIMTTLKNLYPNLKRVTVTGGEPLIHDGIRKLLQTLLEDGYDINVETNGSVLPRRFYPICYPEASGTLFYTMDWKCESSGMQGHMDYGYAEELNSDDVLKFVVGSREDLDGALAVIEKIRNHPQIYFSPVFGKIEAKEIVDYLLEKQLYDCKVQLQLHKFIWEPTTRGV